MRSIKLVVGVFFLVVSFIELSAQGDHIPGHIQSGNPGVGSKSKIVSSGPLIVKYYVHGQLIEFEKYYFQPTEYWKFGIGSTDYLEIYRPKMQKIAKDDSIWFNPVFSKIAKTSIINEATEIYAKNQKGLTNNDFWSMKVKKIRSVKFDVNGHNPSYFFKIIPKGEGPVIYYANYTIPSTGKKFYLPYFRTLYVKKSSALKTRAFPIIVFPVIYPYKMEYINH